MTDLVVCGECEKKQSPLRGAQRARRETLVQY
jgi:hypothetical protein